MKPSIPKGFRDFSSIEVERRNYIFDTIKRVFVKYGFEPIETPALENLNTLTEKYGNEGDRLIFKILNSGNYLEKLDLDNVKTETKQFTSLISEKALRYDLTIPFARYIAMNRDKISLPFKRYQIQPVWRADRPQKGRYREFYQCDADIAGSKSLLNEVELILIYDEVFSCLGFKDFTVKINHRNILGAIAEAIGKPDCALDMTVAIDKLDAIGFEGVKSELLKKGFSEENISLLLPYLNLSGSNRDKLKFLKSELSNVNSGIKDIETIIHYLDNFSLNKAKLEFDISLARGLSYYTGTIFEVKNGDYSIGSIGGGGRYDNLTDIFGFERVSGVGISFGADRIYDVMQALNLFPDHSSTSSRILIVNFGGQEELYAIGVLSNIRNRGFSSELYPDAIKIQKQFKYADDKNIPYVFIMGENEIISKTIAIKNMKTGKQENISIENLYDHLENL